MDPGFNSTAISDGDLGAKSFIISADKRECTKMINLFVKYYFTILLCHQNIATSTTVLQFKSGNLSFATVIVTAVIIINTVVNDFVSLAERATLQTRPSTPFEVSTLCADAD